MILEVHLIITQKNRLLEYFDLLDSSEFGNFRISSKTHIEKYWTTNEIFEYFNVRGKRDY